MKKVYNLFLALLMGIFMWQSAAATNPGSDRSDPIISENDNSQSVIEANALITDVTCNLSNGEISVSFSGGVGNYYPTWTDQTQQFLGSSSFISGLTSGTYYLNVTDDDGNILDTSFIVGEIPIIQIDSFSVSDVTIFGGSNGSIDLFVSGGTQPYFYYWNTGAYTSSISNLTAGNYWVFVTDANQCIASEVFTIDQPEELSISIEGNDLLCFGESNDISAIAEGGQAPYSFLWSTGSTNQSVNINTAGLYSVTVTDAVNYSKTSSITISQISEIIISDLVTQETCIGGYDAAIDITVTGGEYMGMQPILTYEWTGPNSFTATTEDINNLMPGEYNLLVIASFVNENEICTQTTNFVISEPIDYNVTNNNCFGASNGAIDITVNTGSTPFTFLWSNNATTEDISSLPIGNYTVTITDGNNCSITENFNINEPSDIVAIELITDVSCNGSAEGEISLNVSGGTAPYTFIWSNGNTTQNVTGLLANNYSATISDANLCTKVYSYTITEPTAISITETITDASCSSNSDGAIDITVTGGLSPYTYDWGSGITSEDLTNIAAGAYGVTVTDQNNCSASGIYDVFNSTVISINGTVTDVTCNSGNDGAVDISVSGGAAPYTFMWTGGVTTEDISNISAGTFKVTVTDANGCMEFSTNVISEPVAIVSFIESLNVNCNGGSDGDIDLTVLNAVTPVNYLWSNGSGSEDLSNVSAGSYSVTITDNNGCIAYNNQTITEPVAIEFNGQISAASCNGLNDGSINLIPFYGTPPYLFLWTTGSTVEDQPSLTGGEYSVTITDAEGCTNSETFIVPQPDALSLTFNSQEPACYGSQDGSIGVTVSGGTSPYDYLWNNSSTSNSINNILADDYSIIITDANNCVTTSNYTLSEPMPLDAGAIVTNISCFGANDGEITLNPNGGVAPYSLTWDDGSTSTFKSGLAGGEYHLVITDSTSCSKNIFISVNEPDELSASVATISDYNGFGVSCFGNNDGEISAEISGGNQPYSIVWTDDSQNSVGTMETISGLSAGSYEAQISDANGCAINISQNLYPVPWAYNITGTNHIILIENTADINISGSPIQNGDFIGVFYNDNGTSVCGGYTQWTGVTTSIAAWGSESGMTNGFASGEIIQWKLFRALDGLVFDLSAVYTIDTVQGFSSDGLYNDNALSSIATLSGTGQAPPTVSLSTTVTEPGNIVITETITDALCNGSANGSINISVAGGILPYSFIWSDGSTNQNILNISTGNYDLTVSDANGCSQTVSYFVGEASTITVTETVVNATCFGYSDGSIDITVSGGTAPYSYIWDYNGATTEDISGLSIGNYNLTVTDNNNCSTFLNYTITEPTEIAISDVVTDAVCNGASDGSVDITVSGGTPLYSFIWTDGYTTEDISLLDAGTYKVTVTDAAGCFGFNTSVVSEPVAITGFIESLNVSCNSGSDGNLDLTVNNAVTPITYSWSSGDNSEDLTNVGAGTYTVTATDNNNCIAIFSQTITEPVAIEFNEQIQSASCNGFNDGSINLIPLNGTPPYLFLWTTGSTIEDQQNLTGGEYSVTITDADGCSNSDTFYVPQPDVLDLSFTEQSATCFGALDGSLSVSVNGGTTPYNYLWGIDNSTGTTISNLLAGDYSVTVTDANGCSETATGTISDPLPLVISADIQNLTCFESGDGSISLNIAGGIAPYTYIWNNGATDASISSLTSGDYNVIVSDSVGCIKNGFFTITEPDLFVASAFVSSDYSGFGISCPSYSDGEVSLTVSGGNQPYTYNWIDTASGLSVGTQAVVGNLPAGIYEAQVSDANGCNLSISQTNFQLPWTYSITGSNHVILIENTASINISGISIQNGDYIGVFYDNNGVAECAGYVEWTGITTSVAAWADDSGLGIGFTGGENIQWKMFRSSDGSIFDLNPVYDSNFPQTGLFTTNGLSSVSSLTGTGQAFVSEGLLVTITEPIGMTITETIADALCPGSLDGTIDLAVSGGAAPYTFNWSDGSTSQNLSGLATGNYDLTISDANNCSLQLSYFVGEASAISALETITNASCFGYSDGTIDLTVAGGTPPYTYLWDTGATTEDISSLTANSYAVTITDNHNCLYTNSYSITEPTEVSITDNITDAICFGTATGAVDISVSGGTAPYTYLWTGSATTEDLTNIPTGTYKVTVTDVSGCLAYNTSFVSEATEIISFIESLNVSCNGGSDGSLDLTVINAVTPINFSWSDGSGTEDLSNVQAGTYDVTVTDGNGCLAYANQTITEPVAIQFNEQIASTSCFGGNNGSINLIPMNGTPPYLFLWTTGSTIEDQHNLQSGEYSVTITDAEGCSNANTFTVPQPDSLIVNFNNTNPSCFGSNDGIISANPVGGTSPYNYLWDINNSVSTSVSNLLAGTYNLTITDANLCVSTINTTLTEPSPILAQLNVNDISCNGLSTGSIEVIPSGGTAPYSYLFSNGTTDSLATGLSLGTYSVIVTDASGCSKSFTANINQPDVLIASASTISDFYGYGTSCYSSADGQVNATVSGGVQPYSFEWFDDVTGSSVGTIQDQGGLTSGTYNVVVTDANGCIAGINQAPIAPNWNYQITASNHVILIENTANINISGVSIQNGDFIGVFYDNNGSAECAGYVEWTGLTTSVAAWGSESGMNNGFASNETIQWKLFRAVDGSVFDLTPVYSTASNFSSDGLFAVNALSSIISLQGTGAAYVAPGLSTIITAPDQILIGETIVDALCDYSSDGSISVNATNGIAPYTYSWSTGGNNFEITNLPVGDYTVTVTDDHGCEISATYSVGSPLPISSIINVTNPTCNGYADGSIDIEVSGGTSPYLFNWDNNSTIEDPNGLSDGTYYVTVSDINGCEYTANTTVSEPPAISISEITNDVICYNGATGSIDITVINGVGPFTYNWTEGFTTEDISGITAGNYSVTITDATSCEFVSNPITINQSTEIQISSNVIDETFSGASNGLIDITVSGGLPPYSFEWSNNSISEDISGLSAGNYTVTITDFFECTMIETITVNLVGLNWQVNVGTGGDMHSIVIPFDAQMIINNQQITAGDYIGLFYYDNSSNEACAAFTQWLGTGTTVIAMGDDPATGIKDGFTTGEEFMWKIYDVSEDSVFDVIANYNTLLYSQTGQFVANGLSGILGFTDQVNYTTQQIPLNSGWNMISTYMYPSNANIASVFSDISSNVNLVKDVDGMVYYPQWNVNLIGNMTIGEGYLVNMLFLDTLEVIGNQADPIQTDISIENGWNLIGYLHETEASAEIMMASISSSIIVMKNGQGLIYWPLFNINSIGNMIPGQGYQLKSSDQTQIFNYPSITGNTTKSNYTKPEHFKSDRNTGVNMSLLLPNESWESLPNIGDEIAVFTKSGMLVGSSVYNGAATAISIWGNDSYSEIIDGLQENEEFFISLWNSKSRIESRISISSWIEGDGFYSDDKIAIAAKALISDISLYDVLKQNTPNPFNNTSIIEFSLGNDSKIELSIFDDLGRKIQTVLYGDYKSGNHSIEIKAQNFASGIYYYKLKTGNSVLTQKMIIE